MAQNNELVKLENENKNNNEELYSVNLKPNKKNSENNTRTNHMNLMKSREEVKNTSLPNQNFLNDYYKNEDSKINISKTKDGKSVIDMNEIIGKKDSEIPISLDILQEPFDNIPKHKISTRDFGIIKAYAANTSQGIVRDYNEDRVSIVINMVKPQNCQIDDSEWPRISYFGIFDGHAGNKCAEYLKDNLIKKISSNAYFPNDMIKAIKYGFENAEKDFLENHAVHNNKLIDRSGSCALILLTVNNTLYIANVGDSRCVVSCSNGKVIKDVTRDHKPNYPHEKERILKNGGSVYQTEIPLEFESEDDDDDMFKDKVILGPYRVIPGRLSVSRTLGDAEAKVPSFGGNPKVIICEPDIFVYDLEKDDVDFFIMGCDGIYDQLSSKDVVDCAWMVFNASDLINNNLNISCGNIVDLILKMSMIRKSYDNVTCLIIALKEREDLRYSKSKKDIVLNCYNEIKFYNKISNNTPVIKINKNTEKTLFLNKNKLPSIQLMNRNKNNMKFKKLFKNNNYFSNYINKLSITNLNNNNSRFNKKEENENNNIRNTSVPSHQSKNTLNVNCITLHKNDFQSVQRNANIYSSPVNTNSKKSLETMTVNLTEPNIKNNLRNNMTLKSKSIFTNSTKNNRIDFLYLNKNSSQGSMDEVNSNNDSLIQKKSIPINSVTPTSIRVKNNPMLTNDYTLDGKGHAKYHSVNKKNSIMIDPNLIHKNENQINYNNKIYGLRVKNVEDKLPLYQKAFKGTLISSRKKDFYSHILDRNRNNISLKNNKMNMLNLENMSNIIQNENSNNLLEKKNFYPSIEDSHRNNNNIKMKKPMKLKLDFLNVMQINKNHSISASKYNVTDINSQAKMPLIIQQKKVSTNPNNV